MSKLISTRGIPIPGRRPVRHASLATRLFRRQPARVFDQDGTWVCWPVSAPHHCAILRANERGHPCRYGVVGSQQSEDCNFLKAAFQVWMAKRKIHDIYTRWNNKKNDVELRTNELFRLALGRRSQGEYERNAMLSTCMKLN